MGEYSFPSFPSLPSFSLAIHVINKVLYSYEKGIIKRLRMGDSGVDFVTLRGKGYFIPKESYIRAIKKVDKVPPKWYYINRR